MIIINKSDHPEGDGDEENHPDIAIIPARPEQGREQQSAQNQQPAHGRRALFGLQMAFRSVVADRLPPALLDAQGFDQRGTEQEDRANFWCR